MREIKFRSWLKFKGKMLYDFDVLYNGKVSETSKRVLMQYTGLKDKNGKEIYEGDIICYNRGQTESREKMTVMWMDAGFVLSAYKEDWSYYLSDCIPVTLEVIGNIYENQELLGGV